MPDLPSRADGAVPPPGDSALDELLTAAQPPQDAAAGLQPVAAALAALRARPTDGELAGQARVLAEFRSTVRVSHRTGRSRRPVPLRERLSSKLAVITAATAVAVSGTVAAAYIGALPGPLQRAANDVFAARVHGRAAPAAVRAHPFRTPSTMPSPSLATSPPGWRPDQAGPATKHHKRHGHHQDHRGRRTTHHQGAQGDQQGDGPAARPENNPMAHHKGSRLQSPLPRAAAFPIPPAGPDRPGTGGR
jgi:hypothetical protein